MMHGGAIVRSRKIRIIRNALMVLLSLPANSAWDICRMDPESASAYHTLGESPDAKVAGPFGISTLAAKCKLSKMRMQYLIASSVRVSR
jgi:hypothetical protein